MDQDISVRLPGDLEAELEQLGQETSTTKSDLIREAVREYLFAHQLHSLHQRLRPYAEAQEIYNDEDVFNEFP